MDASQFDARAGDGMDAGVEATQDAVARCPVGEPMNPAAGRRTEPPSPQVAARSQEHFGQGDMTIKLSGQ
ncbi:hypothetical protein CS053_03010 [Rhodanobacter glycinis]|uniref:Uncharacterized protein n=1 Tax=Rhodanobacter glycinis TaxID=582702 RepID=A0A5B9DWT0_9GAMM|nr:hypothetical protein [Rhodanobacter glycinis]QEE23594.1 hypothetical protein CS053_03010 [Rhodanobacter glycinis]